MAFVSGAAGDITIGGTVMKVKKWSGKFVRDEIDTSRKGDGGWRTNEYGLQHFEGDIEFDFDTAIHATGTLPVPLGNTTVSAAFDLSMDDGTNDGGSWSFNGKVFELGFDSAAEGIINCTGNFKSSGTVLYNEPA